MFRATGVLVLSLCFGPAALSQAVPKDLLSLPVSLGLDKPTTEVKAGSTVTYTVTLRNTRDQAVAASSDLQLAIETPSGMQEATLQRGQSSASFSWQAVKSGVVHMTVRSGKLHPATGLVLVAPGPTAQLPSLPFSEHAVAEMAHSVPQTSHTFALGSLAASQPAHTPPAAEHHIPLGVMVGKQAAGAAAQSAPSLSAAAPSQPAAPVPAALPGQAKKIQIYIQPLPVYGNAVDRIWKANVSVAAEGQNDELMAVSEDVPVHFIASFGQLSASDITLSPGQFSNFEKPIMLTANLHWVARGRSVLTISSPRRRNCVFRWIRHCCRAAARAAQRFKSACWMKPGGSLPPRRMSM
jgi:hypothetical protein